MKYFFDTEFIEDGKTIDLISIGIVAEDGREFYACNTEARLDLANDWVRGNVLPSLPTYGADEWVTRFKLRGDVLSFVDNFGRIDLAKDKPEFWAYYCVAPETRVLTRDLKWVPIMSLRVGDVLVGFDEMSEPGNGRSSRWRQWRPSIVERLELLDRSCYDLTFEDGTFVRCATDHRWLASNTEGAKWVPASKLVPGVSAVAKPLDVWREDASRSGGYLAAAFDGEGHIQQDDLSAKPRGIRRFRLGFAQKENAMLSTVQQQLSDHGFRFSLGGNKKTGVHHVHVSNREDVLRFLGSIRPVRLLGKFDPKAMGAMSPLRAVKLVSKVDSGVRGVVNIETSTKTYIAEGLASHNCSYDWVAFCQLFGRMMDLPKGFPMWCRDLKQLSEDKGSPRHPEQKSGEHNALEDARWNARLYEFLTTLEKYPNA